MVEIVVIMTAETTKVIIVVETRICILIFGLAHVWHKLVPRTVAFACWFIDFEKSSREILMLGVIEMSYQTIIRVIEPCCLKCDLINIAFKCVGVC